MKVLLLALLMLLAFDQEHLKSEVEAAFLQFDIDQNGIVTKHEIMEVLMMDPNFTQYSRSHVEQMIAVIE